MLRNGSITLLSFFLLSACSGGGGGGGGSGGGAGNGSSGGSSGSSNSTPDVAPAATFIPSQMDLAYTAGDSISFDIEAQASRSINGGVYIRITDSVGIITTDVALQKASTYSYIATLHTSPLAGAGHYTGNIKVELCKDAGCASQWPGSPVLFPYDFQIYAPTDLISLSRSISASDWETLQGNAAHTGYVDIALDPSRISQRWQWTAPNNITPAVVANGLVYVSSANNFPDSQTSYSDGTLFAINESDGTTVWQHDFGADTTMSPPGVSGHKVVVSSQTYDSASRNWIGSMSAFADTDGTQLFHSNFSGGLNFSPMINGAEIYAEGEAGLSRADGNTGSQSWSVAINQMPALDSAYAYFSDGSLYDTRTLYAYKRTDGTLAFTITSPSCCTSENALNFGSTVLTPNNSVVAVRTDGALDDFDLGTQSVKWSILGAGGNVAVANGVVYVLRGDTLYAHSESDGSVLWSWEQSIADGFSGYENLIITNNMAIISIGNRVHAISLDTHKSIWTFGHTGQLALSANGVLYIATGKTLYAVNMK